MKKQSKAFETALSLIQAEVIGEKLAEKMPIVIEKPVVVEKLVTPPKPSTKIIDMANEQVSEKRWLIDEAGEGTLDELVLVGDSKNYSLTVIVDGKPTYKGSWTDYQTESRKVGDIVAYEENGTFTLNLSAITFTKTLKILIEPTTTIVFSTLHIKYEIA